MSHRAFKLFLMTVLIALIAGLVALRSAPPATATGDDTEALVGKPAPEVNLVMTDGKPFKLSDQKGSVVVLDFWATWCPPCRRSLPHLSKVSSDKALADKGLKVYAVNAREAKDKAAEYLKTNNLALSVPLDSDGKAMDEYMVHGIPTTVVVGRDGVIKNVFVGFGGEESEQSLDDAIEKSLAEKN